MRIHRVIVPVPDTDAGATFYSKLLGQPGERVAMNRHYFDCGVVLAVVGPGERQGHSPLPDYLYFTVDDLDSTYERAHRSGASIEEEITTHSWGERSFYLRDPWDNPLCIVDETTAFTGGRFVE